MNITAEENNIHQDNIDESTSVGNTNNKYYIPKIEEFYVGFEYIRIRKIDKDRGVREIHTCTYKDLCNLTVDDGTMLGKIDFNKKVLGDVLYTSVKFLDQEDIERLGWKEDEPKLGEIFLYNNYMLQRDINKEELFIIELESKKTIFIGTIKNKSELIKLMKQVNIK